MKKTILILAAVFAAIVSCQKAETENTTPVLTRITVVAENSLDTDTKVTVGEKNADNICPVLWQAGDRVCLIDRTSEQPRTILAVATVPSEYDKSQSANLTFDVDLAEYPDTKTLGLMVCREGFLYDASKEIPQNQVQKGLGAENTNMMDYMYGYTQTTRSCRDKDGNVISNLSFSIRHPFAYVKIPFWSTKFAGYKVTSIVLTNVDGAKRLSGRMTINGAANPSDAIVTMHASQDNVNLTFSEDVVVPGSEAQAQGAWLVAIPTAVKGETTTDSVYSVTFNLVDEQGKTVTAVVKFKTILKAESVNVLKVGEILESDVVESKDISNDFFEQYLAGDDIQIGNLVVNKENYPEYTRKQPSEITLDLLKAGGLIFIDDETGTGVIDLSTTNSYESCPYNNNLVLIGRYKKNGAQTELKIKQWRTWYDLAMANVKLTCTYSTPQLQLFAKTSSDTRQTKLFLQDCNIDMTHAKYLIEDMENAKSVPYSDIRVDNCVVKMSDSVKETSLYRYRNVTELQENISLTNNVVYTPSLKDFESHLFRIYSDYAASGMTVTIANNTVINIHGNTGVIRRGGSLAGMTVCGNLVVTDNTANEVMTTANNRNVFFLKNIGTMSAGNNFLTTINYTGDDGTINKSKMQSLTKTTTDKDEQTVNPFTSMNYTTGYFPINSTVVTNGAGASYDTKYYITR